MYKRQIYDFDAQKDIFAKSIFSTDVSYPGFENLVSEEVEAPGYDGTMIPLSIIYKKGIPLDGSNCCILRGYGAYGLSATPSFSIFNSLANHGVVLAFAHVRGGSEKGEAWYKAGYKTTKPNTWKDFISCAEYLVKKGYTSPQKLACTGRSAGGILISRAITDRPDLFAAALCNVGCANAMRMEFTPNGPPNIPEFGTVKDPVSYTHLDVYKRQDVCRADRRAVARARTPAPPAASLHPRADEFRAQTARRRRPSLGHSRQRPAHRQFPARLPIRASLSDCQAGMFRKNSRTARSRTRTFREMSILEINYVCNFKTNSRRWI